MKGFLPVRLIHSIPPTGCNCIYIYIYIYTHTCICTCVFNFGAFWGAFFLHKKLFVSFSRLANFNEKNISLRWGGKCVHIRPSKKQPLVSTQVAFRKGVRMLHNIATPFSNAATIPSRFLSFLLGLLFHEAPILSYFPGPTRLLTTTPPGSLWNPTFVVFFHTYEKWSHRFEPWRWSFSTGRSQQNFFAGGQGVFYPKTRDHVKRPKIPFVTKWLPM